MITPEQAEALLHSAVDYVGSANYGHRIAEAHEMVDQALSALSSAETAEPVGAIYAECHECTNCLHIGINDSHPIDAACNTCDWSGVSPKEDRCPGCGKEGTMMSACPKCSYRYHLLATSTIAAPQQAAQPAPAGMTDEEIDNLLEQARIGIVEGFGYKYDEKHLAEMLRSLSRSNAPQPESANAACQTCYGTGDVHDQTGEWRGACTACASVQPEAAQPAPMPVARVTVGAMEHGPFHFAMTPRGADALADGTYDLYAAIPLPAQQVQNRKEVHDALQKAFMTLQSSGGEDRSIVLKFNRKENAYIVHDFLLHCAVKDDPSNAGAQQVAEQKDAERMFPMQHPKLPIPWRLAEVIYAGYSAEYGTRQSLERLAERGGFGWAEVGVIYKEPRARKAIDAAITAMTAGGQEK
jgi:hypothetical protein